MIAGWPGYVGVYWKGDGGLGLDAEGANEQDVAKKLLNNQGKKVVAHKDKPGLHLLYRAASNKELEQAQKTLKGDNPKVWHLATWYEENMHYNSLKKIYRWNGKAVVPVDSSEYTDNEGRKKTLNEI